MARHGSRQSLLHCDTRRVVERLTGLPYERC
ncbi:oligogalacturonide transporter [Bifidobacterium longum]|uniref:Oligogalacturonide transporter n=1 Tax=Bifidobacterium longum TaxID=216816 RepID=A0A2U2RQK5_BIFLN|nr:oligogalacturonide transporter [Bifidobacterium longum]